MKIGFVLFEGMTSLDFMGVFDPLSRLKTMGFLKNLAWDLCAFGRPLSDSNGLALAPTRVGMSLDRYDLVVVPGGPSAGGLRSERGFMGWLQTMEPCPFKASVCSRALLLGAAGFLKGKRAATHPDRRVELAEYCARVVDQRVVDEGSVLTCGGVTASIDMGLYLCEKFAGKDAAEKIRRQMDYKG
jgi:transcriptional regulator GlxA family with amidase domain